MNVFGRWGFTNAVGPTQPALEGDAPAQLGDGHVMLHADERRWGMTNTGNTCYANSVLQALYFCEPFRSAVQDGRRPSASARGSASSQINGAGGPSSKPAALTLDISAAKASGPHPSSTDPKSPAPARATRNGGPPPSPVAVTTHHHRVASSSSSSGHLAVGTPPGLPANDGAQSGTAMMSSSVASGSTRDTSPERPSEETLLSTLADLFLAISHHPRRTGVVAPYAFINQLRKQNELYRSTMHQDAHEFLGYLLNAIAEELEKTRPPAQSQADVLRTSSVPSVDGSTQAPPGKTWIHDLFEGVLTNETRCLTCETITSRDEAFLDLSIDIEDNSSVSACLRQFSANEMLAHKDKFLCDTCCGLQEAEKRMIVKKLPRILALHLKRFKYQEDLQRFTKLAYRVAFPTELRLFNTLPTAHPDPDQLYSLWAVIVHIGVGLHSGHYITLLRSLGRWLCFDDETVTEVNQSELFKYFGDTPGAGSGYVLFYEAIEIERPDGTLAHLAHDMTPAQSAFYAATYRAEQTKGSESQDEDALQPSEDPNVAASTDVPLQMPSPGLAQTHTDGISSANGPAKQDKDTGLKGFFGLGRRERGITNSSSLGPDDQQMNAPAGAPVPPSESPSAGMARKLSVASAAVETTAPGPIDNSDAVSTASSQPSQPLPPSMPPSTSGKSLFNRGFLGKTKSTRRPLSTSGLQIDVDGQNSPVGSSTATGGQTVANVSLHQSNGETPPSPTAARRDIKKRGLFGSKS